MNIKEKKRFVIELDDGELNALYDWLAKLVDHSHLADRPKVVDDLKLALYGLRRGI